MLTFFNEIKKKLPLIGLQLKREGKGLTWVEPSVCALAGDFGGAIITFNYLNNPERYQLLYRRGNRAQGRIKTLFKEMVEPGEVHISDVSDLQSGLWFITIAFSFTSAPILHQIIKPLPFSSSFSSSSSFLTFFCFYWFCCIENYLWSCLWKTNICRKIDVTAQHQNCAKILSSEESQDSHYSCVRFNYLLFLKKCIFFLTSLYLGVWYCDLLFTLCLP